MKETSPEFSVLALLRLPLDPEGETRLEAGMMNVPQLGATLGYHG